MDASDDIDDMFVTPDVRARRRRLHTEAEQRRRDAIKRGFDNLLELIHPVKADPGSSLIRMSKATILNRSISLILRLAKQKSQKRMEIDTLQNKVKALQILNSNYERIAVANSYAFDSSNSVVTEPTKIQLFQLFMESLFQSFDSAVSASEMDQLSRQIITWMEISCKPESLRVIMEMLIRRLLDNDREYTQSPQAPSAASLVSSYPVAESAPQFDHSMRKSTSSLLNYKPFAAPQPQTPIFVLNQDQQAMFNTEMPNNSQGFESKACVSCVPGSNFTAFTPASEMVYQRTGHNFNAPDRHVDDPVQQGCDGNFFVMPSQSHERRVSGGSAPLIVPYQSQPTPTTGAAKDVSAEVEVKSLSDTLSPSPSNSFRAGLSRDPGSSRIAGSLVVNSTLPSPFQPSF